MSKYYVNTHNIQCNPFIHHCGKHDFIIDETSLAWISAGCVTGFKKLIFIRVVKLVVNLTIIFSLLQLVFLCILFFQTHNTKLKWKLQCWFISSKVLVKGCGCCLHGKAVKTGRGKPFSDICRKQRRKGIPTSRA